MQVIGTTGWNKNLIAVEGAARSAQDVFEAQPALVRVPGAQWRSGDGAIAGALDEPDDERRVEQTNERRHAQDGLFFSGGGVSESEQLLCFSEKALDRPPGAISGDDRGDIERGVRREEDADRNRSLKWTPSVGPKAGWRKRDACSDFVIIKKHIVVFVVNRKNMSVVSSEHELTGCVSRGVWGETDNLCEVAWGWGNLTRPCARRRDRKRRASGSRAPDVDA